MEPIFSLPYSEYESITQIQKAIRSRRFSYYIPLSRQQKGIDFLIHDNQKSNKIIRFQVKSSKTYLDIPPKKIKNKLYSFHLWLNNFMGYSNYHNNLTDWFIIFGLYPIKSAKSTTKSKSLKDWKPIVLCFEEKELVKIRDEESRFMDIYFNINSKGKVIEVANNRGFIKVGLDLSKYLVENKIKKISRL